MTVVFNLVIAAITLLMAAFCLAWSLSSRTRALIERPKEQPLKWK